MQIGYARVSTKEQGFALQLDALRVVFQTWFSYQNSEFVSIDKETDDDVMHLVEFGETNRLPC